MLLVSELTDSDSDSEINFENWASLEFLELDYRLFYFRFGSGVYNGWTQQIDPFTEFSDSTLGIIESSLCNGPVHFDCYPDFTVSLSDPHILRTLTLNIKTEGYNVLPGT
ncbi:hypothetical protein L3X38_033433 [Prunus dulcis]|uniref:Uncharacterized protein n=1 Tax=Prunus dulcis TaxID=3755 RepID=A0AAD4VFX5_PRUDU|nr:hypothetical protein L3X38_033433 [Prunus dulcis]